MSFGHDISELVAKSERGLLAKHPSWSRVRLSDVAELLNGFPYESTKFNDVSGTPLLRIRDIVPGRTETRYDGSVDDPRMIRVRNGDVVVGMDGDFNATIWEDGEALLNQRVCLLRAREALYSQRFLAYLIPGYLKLINDNTSSVTVKHLSSKTVQDTPLPFPPLAEQQRIVARVDALFAEIAEGEAALAEARKGLDIFRRALLKAAVTGELTKDWRAKNPQAEASRDFALRVTKNQIGIAKRSSQYLPPDASTLPALPETWTWETLDRLVTSGPTNGYSPKRSRDGSGTLALKLTATTKGELDLRERAVKSLSKSVPFGSDLYLKPNDLLFQRGNTIEYVGIAAIYDGPTDTYVYPDLMIRVRTADPKLTEWIWRVANSPFGRKFMSANATGTAGTMPKVSGAILRKFPVPMPPAAERAEILRRVSDALAASAEAVAILDAETADAARLEQSILKAAFEGRLVPQDPADERAGALLVRLAAGTPAPRYARGRARKKTA